MKSLTKILLISAAVQNLDENRSEREESEYLTKIQDLARMETHAMESWREYFFEDDETEDDFIERYTI